MIGEALQFIVPSKRAVLLLSYFAGYSDKDTLDHQRLCGTREKICTGSSAGIDRGEQ